MNVLVRYSFLFGTLDLNVTKRNIKAVLGL